MFAFRPRVGMKRDSLSADCESLESVRPVGIERPHLQSYYQAATPFKRSGNFLEGLKNRSRDVSFVKAG